MVIHKGDFKKWIHTSDIIKIVEKRRDWVEDTIIALTGDPGMRKSQLACKLAKKYDPNFSYDRNLFYSRTKFVQAIDEYPDCSALIADEAINMLFKREWNNRDQVNITKLFDRCRYKKHLIILCIPNMFALDKHIRDTRITLWVNIYNKDEKNSVARMWVRENNEAVEDPWNRPWMVTCLRMHKPYRSVNYVGHLQFSQMKQEDYEAYYKVKVAKNNEEEIKPYEWKDIEKLLNIYESYTIKRFYDAGILTANKVAPILKLSNQTVLNRIYNVVSKIVTHPQLHKYILFQQSKNSKQNLTQQLMEQNKTENEQDNNIPTPTPETEPPNTNLIKYSMRKDGDDSRTTIFQTPPIPSR